MELYSNGFGNIIIVDNLPEVDAKTKKEKLEDVIHRIYSQIGAIKENGLCMPVDPQTQSTLGYCFIEFNTPEVPLSLSLSLSPLIDMNLIFGYLLYSIYYIPMQLDCYVS